eukprot:5876882-Alexandrium_andersonii.AAC.1
MWLVLRVRHGRPSQTNRLRAALVLSAEASSRWRGAALRSRARARVSFAACACARQGRFAFRTSGAAEQQAAKSSRSRAQL